MGQSTKVKSAKVSSIDIAGRVTPVRNKGGRRTWALEKGGDYHDKVRDEITGADCVCQPDIFIRCIQIPVRMKIAFYL